MSAHACRGHPIKAGARAGHETGRAAIRHTVWHGRVPAPRVDQLVQLPALIRPRPRLERLLDRLTLAGCQLLGGLLLPQTIGRLLGSCGGIKRAHGHPVPTPPGRFPLDTGRIQAWSSHFVALRPDRGVTLWDVMALKACCATYAARTKQHP
jgi:hypothetical protein